MTSFLSVLTFLKASTRYRMPFSGTRRPRNNMYESFFSPKLSVINFASRTSGRLTPLGIKCVSLPYVSMKYFWTPLLKTMISSAYFTAFFSPPRMNLDATLPRHFSRAQSKPWIVLITRLPKSFGIQQKKAGPSAWICTTSYLPNALQSAAKKEELTAASPFFSMVGTTFWRIPSYSIVLSYSAPLTWWPALL